MLTIAQTTLNTAGQIFQDPKNWTHDVSARNNIGEAVEPQAEDAICWCIVGLLGKLCEYDTMLKYTLTDFLSKTATGQSQNEFIHLVNDELGREAVLQMIEEAKPIAEKFASIPNLDALSEEELRNVYIELGDNLPQCSQRHYVLRYIDHKINAVMYRKAGHIPRAIDHETQCDKIYGWMRNFLNW